MNIENSNNETSETNDIISDESLDIFKSDRTDQHMGFRSRYADAIGLAFETEGIFHTDW